MKQHTASIFRANFGYVSTLQSIVWMWSKSINYDIKNSLPSSVHVPVFSPD
jgi:hypothetical protein